VSSENNAADQEVSMQANKRRFWPSPQKHAHVLGEVRRVAHGTGTISALYLYEQSVMRGCEPAELPPARARALIGECNGIICTVCGKTVDWTEAPTEAYLRLMERYPRRPDA
jgi:hypothetical protein